jgi:hypothetical protein
MSAQGKNGEFYTKGKDVWKSPTVTRNTDNTGDSIEVGFKVCTVSEWLDAETVVGVFTEHAALQERVRRLEEALKPFADDAMTYDPPEDDDHFLAWNSEFKIGALRRARAALGKEG